MRQIQHLISLGSLSLVCATCFLYGQDNPRSTSDSQENIATEIKLKEGWALSLGFRGRARVSLPTDAIEWAWLNEKLTMPIRTAAESPSGSELPSWKRIEADENGGFSGRELTGGWLATFVESPEAGVWLLDAQGHNSVLINGTPRVGDVYSNGSVELPVLLRAGTNSLIFSGSRGRIAARLHRPEKEVFISHKDSTYPHVIRGESEDLWGACLLVNATDKPQTDLLLRVSGSGFQNSESKVTFLAPLSVRKIAFHMSPDSAALAEAWQSEKVPVDIELSRANGAVSNEETVIDRATVEWSVRNPTQTHRRTFRSELDGSVQYYGVVPPAGDPTANGNRPDLILSLHGAGVEGEGQAGVYSAKPNTYVITPTNRRSFGFDWEDWGRWDALEVLNQAQSRFNTNPQRTYLTGHSMGGHGTWHIGSLFPDKFAAIGPSAGWISFTSYAGRDTRLADDPISKMIRRPLLVGDTLARVKNLAHQGVFVLHGDKDDNVPVGQARTMREELAKFHPDFVYKEQPGAGHWWGNACCDWPPLIAFFADHQLPTPDQVSDIDFLTPCPAASASCFWMTVAAQTRQGQMSRGKLTFSREQSTISGTTENILRLALKLSLLRTASAAPLTTLTLDIDDSKLENVPVAQLETLWLSREGGQWVVIDDPGTNVKGPLRCGVFKEAFKNRFMLVYGTKGTPEENAWMMERARFDAESFWYRGNGSAEVVPDTQWEANAETDRSVIVYGNSTINSAWQELLSEAPLKMERDHCQIASEPVFQTPVAVWMIRPRPGSSVASVAAIGGTNLLAMRSTTRAPIFSSGTGFPDLLVVSPDYLEKGIASVLLTGYFGNDWSFESGEWVRPGDEVIKVDQ